jgi:hypothetical protein
MQLSVPFITVSSLIFKVTQEKEAGQITKAFVALSIVVKIDDMFSSSLPKEIIDNAEWLNKSKKLRIPSIDNHNWGKIGKRIK